MKPEVTLKYLSYLQNKKEKGESGFTLIELLVVVIIIGVLAAVALPNLLKQVGKAREVEIKNAAGTVARNQQAYHFERQSFANTTAKLGLDTAFANSDYLDATDPVTISGVTSAFATVVTKNPKFTEQGTRAYSSANAYNSTDAEYDQILCQTDVVTESGIVVPDAATGALTCGADSAPIN